MQVIDLDTLDYRLAWAEQEKAHAEVVAGGEERILIVEHPPTITLGRRADTSRSHLKCEEHVLKQRGVALVESDRGGDVTYHGPGQLVAYPIIRLADHGLSVGAYVRQLEQAVIECLGVFGVAAHRDSCAVGVWTDGPTGPVKLAAIGVRVKQGVTLHGLALNVETDLAYFDLIIPCGLEGRAVSSLRKLLHEHGPSFEAAKAVLIAQLRRAFPPPPRTGILGVD